jgi:serine acetyltransferase
MILGKRPNWRTIHFYVFMSLLYMFRATSCSSSGESIVSIQPLVYVTLCRWPFCVQVRKDLSDLHMKWSPTQSDIYQMLYCYNWFSWWRARGCSKHVENWHKYIEKNCASSWSRSPTQCDIHQRLYWYKWFSWWWAWGCSKHVRNWHKYIEKNCASSWSRSPTQCDIYQRLYWYNWFSWWWAQGCLKHVENWNKYIDRTVRQVGHLPRITTGKLI